MITLIDEDRMTLRNYDNFMQVRTEDLGCYIVDWNKSLDSEVIINFFTLEMDEAYNSDVI